MDNRPTCSTRQCHLNRTLESQGHFPQGGQGRQGDPGTRSLHTGSQAGLPPSDPQAAPGKGWMAIPSSALLCYLLLVTGAATVQLFARQHLLEGQPAKQLRYLIQIFTFLPLLHELGLYGNPPAPASAHKCPQPSSLLTTVSVTI